MHFPHAWLDMGLFAVALLAGPGVAARAESTIDPAHPYAYGANVGWIHARGSDAHGAILGRYHASNHLYGANIGWVSLGDGSPANGHTYANTSAADFGVNHDGAGRLSGCAWGANVGWLVFEQTHGRPCIDLRTGDLSGHVWAANLGWVSLSNAYAHVRTTMLDPGPDSEPDALPDAWEYRHTNSLSALSGLGGADADGDGSTDAQEYGADTDPFDDGARLAMVGLSVTGQTHTLRWTARPTRLYRLQSTNTLNGGGAAWADAGGGLMGPPDTPVAEVMLGGIMQTTRFYRVEAVMPLSE
jgi:hypothetical protein